MRYCLILVFSLLFIRLPGQVPRKDTPRQSSQLTDAIARQVEVLIQRCEHFKYNNPDSLLVAANQLVELGKQNPQSNYRFWGMLYQGVYDNNNGEATKSLELAQKTIPLVKSGPKDDRLLSMWYTLEGISFMKLNRQREALELFYSALKVSEKINDKEAEFKLSNNIGWAFMELNQFRKAIDNFQNAIQFLRDSGLPDRFGTIYNNLASCYGNIGLYDSAYFYAEKGISTGKKYDDLVAQANGLNIRGNFLSQQNRYREALESFMAARPLREQLGDPFYIVSDLAEIAELQSKTGDTAAGIQNCREALAIAQKNRIDAKLPMIYSALAHNYEVAGNYKEAVEAYKKLDTLKDRLYAAASPSSMAEVQLKYETEKKEHQIQQQKFAITQRNYWIIGIVTFLLLGSLLTWSLYRRYRLKQDTLLQDKLLQRQEIITQAVLKAEETERQRIAKDLHDGVGQMMSAAKMNLSAIEHEIPFQHPELQLKFSKIIELVDESCREVRAVSHNMMPNVLLKDGLGSAIRTFIDRVDTRVLKISLYSEGLHDRLQSNIENILYRVIQECVNNVIKHSAAGDLTISLIKEKDVISAIIEDNGVGFNIAGIDKFEGMGLKNIRTRIDYLKGTVEFDSRPGNGTLVAIHIPLHVNRN
jgi:two-component system, NarL family, sensor kinase